MPNQEEHDIASLETQITSLQEELIRLASEDDLSELIGLIRKPFWTTPAEYLLVNGAVSIMREQTRLLAEQKRVLMEGSRAVSAG